MNLSQKAMEAIKNIIIADIGEFCQKVADQKLEEALRISRDVYDHSVTKAHNDHRDDISKIGQVCVQVPDDVQNQINDLLSKSVYDPKHTWKIVLTNGIGKGMAVIGAFARVHDCGMEAAKDWFDSQSSFLAPGTFFRNIKTHEEARKILAEIRSTCNYAVFNDANLQFAIIPNDQPHIPFSSPVQEEETQAERKI